MASNSFGNLFKIMTWGESHGKAIGVVIDGCPAGLSLTNDDINQALKMRAPGNSPYTSPRKEHDIAEIYSGVFEGVTTGAPISVVIANQDAKSSSYEPIKHLLRPGHANFTYLEKYGVFDYRGGGRASARETACRVAAGAVAKKLLAHYQIKTCAYLYQVGAICASVDIDDLSELNSKIVANPIFCPDSVAEMQMMESILMAKEAGDSLGGIVAFVADGLPVGWGDPIYEKLEANLAKAMLSIPASKGFEIGEGFSAAFMSGSMHNDAFMIDKDTVKTSTNHAGGTLGGISTGMPLFGRVVFKPTSSINKTQKTVDIKGLNAELKLPEGSRHDPCVAIRAVPVVDAMCALVLADALLMNRCVRL
jgi:chorismate synthase